MTGWKVTGQGQYGTEHNQHEQEEKGLNGSPNKGLNLTSSVNGGGYARTTGANAGDYGAVPLESYTGTGGSPLLPTSVQGPYPNATTMYPYPNTTTTYGASGGAGQSGSYATPTYGSASGESGIPTGTEDLGAIPGQGGTGGVDVPSYPMTTEGSGDTASGYGGSNQDYIPTGTGNLGALPSYGGSGGGDSSVVPPYPMISGGGESYPGANGAGGNSSYGGGSPLVSGGVGNGGLGSQTTAGLGSVESGSYGSMGASGSGSGEGIVSDCPAIEGPTVTTITETVSVTITISSGNSFETDGNGGGAMPTYGNENPFPSYNIGTIGTIGTGTGSLPLPTGGPYSNTTAPTTSAAGGGASAGILPPLEEYGSLAGETSDETGRPELEGMASASGMVGFE
ncbi:MAG: hypothetical protein Q9184_001292 [Pyrenodesmia sp. 2 TL-2023]